MITEPAVRRHIVVRDADHLPSGSRKVFKVITKSLSLDGASRRFIFRIKRISFLPWKSFSVRTQPWSSFNAKSGAGSPTFNTSSVIQNSSSQSSVCTLHTAVMTFMVQRTYTSLTALGRG